MKSLGECRRFAAMALLLLATATALPAIEGEWRPLNAAERRVVELMTAYCAAGRETLWDALATDAPLRRLGRESALDELEARLGPPCSGAWELQTVLDEGRSDLAVMRVQFPSGIDQVLFFDLDGAVAAAPPTLRRVRLLEEIGARGESPEAPTAAAGFRAPPLFLIPLLLLALAIPLVPALDRPAVFSPMALLLISSTSLLVLSCDRDTQDRSTTTDAAFDQPRLGSELETRKALLLGTDGVADRLVGEGEPPLDGMRAIWRIQWSVIHDPPEEALALLERTAPDSRPIIDLLRARLSFLKSDDRQTAPAYRRALDGLPPFNSVAHEAAVTLYALGYEQSAERYFELLARGGTRQADVWYTLARLAILDGARSRAEELFLTGWQLLPLERREVLEDGVLSALLAPDRPIYRTLRLDQTEEPVVEPERRETPLELPPDVVASTQGASLRLMPPGAGARRFRGEMIVHGGAALAPPSASPVSAGAWQRARQRQLLDDLQGLLRAASSPGATTRPDMREDLRLAATGLARQHRWRDLVRLTAPLAGQLDQVDSRIIEYRALALERLGERARSIRLLAALVKHILTNERRSPGALYSLADMLAGYGRHETAERLILRADSMLPSPYAAQRIRQIRLEARLASSFLTHRSGSFEIRHPPGREDLASRMAQVLEAERARLATWIPIADPRPIEVHVMRFSDFSELYGGNVETLGVYDGRIRVPLADIWGFHPFLVSILSHELVHAMVAEYTDNQAPKWLHEGLAQLLEMTPSRTNPMADYRRTGRLLSLPMVEATLAGFPNAALVATAYDQAVWTLCYVQERYGVAGMRKLLTAFRDGATTEEALRRAFSRSLSEFDRELRDWWLDGAPAFWTSEVHAYETMTDPYVQRPGEVALERRLDLKWWQREN